MTDNINSRLGLDDLLENDISSYELYYSLPRDVQRKIAQKDVRSFGELCAFVNPRTRGDVQ